MFTCNLEYVGPPEHGSQSTSKSKSDLEVDKVVQPQERESQEPVDHSKPLQYNIRFV